MGMTGRKRLPNGMRRDNFLMIRLTKEEKAKLFREAKREGKTVSAYVKERIFGKGE